MAFGRRKSHTRKLANGKEVSVAESSTGKEIKVLGIDHLSADAAHRIKEQVLAEVKFQENAEDIKNMSWDDLPSYVRGHVREKLWCPEAEQIARSTDDAMVAAGVSPHDAFGDISQQAFTGDGTMSIGSFHPEWMNPESRQAYEDVRFHPLYHPEVTEIGFASGTYRIREDSSSEFGHRGVRSLDYKDIEEIVASGENPVLADFMTKLEKFRVMQQRKFDNKYREMKSLYASEENVKEAWESGVDNEILRDLPWDKIWE